MNGHQKGKVFTCGISTEFMLSTVSSSNWNLETLRSDWPTVLHLQNRERFWGGGGVCVSTGKEV